MNAPVRDERLSIDRRTGIIKLHGAAFWGPDDLTTMLTAVTTHVAAAHAEGRRALVLVNLLGAGPQLAETVGRVQARSSTMYRRGDRLAVVLESSLLRRQVTRIERAAECLVFPDAAAAEAWLCSPPGSVPSDHG